MNEKLCTLFKKPLSIDAALTDRDLGILMGFSRMTRKWRNKKHVKLFIIYYKLFPQLKTLAMFLVIQDFNPLFQIKKTKRIYPLMVVPNYKPVQNGWDTHFPSFSMKLHCILLIPPPAPFSLLSMLDCPIDFVAATTLKREEG